MSQSVKVLEHKARVDALALADLLVEFVNGGLLFAPDTVRPVLAARLMRELSAARVRRLAKILDEPKPWEEISGPVALYFVGVTPAPVEPLGVALGEVWPG